MIPPIPRLYLELKSFGKLVAELDRRKIVTKRHDTRVAKYNGGIPFTYGPLAYFLKNRIYVGEMHHGRKWFRGEHQAILDRPTFERVQDLLKSNQVTRRIKHSESGALLRGKLFDDKGNAMSPSFRPRTGSAPQDWKLGAWRRNRMRGKPGFPAQSRLSRDA
jgi:site-specific DNA recombinase